MRRTVRRDESPKARHLAGLGKKVSRAAQGHLQWMLFYYFNRPNAARTSWRFGTSRSLARVVACARRTCRWSLTTIALHELRGCAHPRRGA